MDRVYTDKPLKVLYALAFVACVVAVWAVASHHRETGTIVMVAAAFVALAAVDHVACRRTIVVTDHNVTVTRGRHAPVTLRFADVVATVEGVRGGFVYRFAHTGTGTPIRWPAAQGFPAQSGNLKGLALFEVPSPARGRTCRAVRDDIRRMLAGSNSPQNRPTTGLP